jgi:hypothetical protein
MPCGWILSSRPLRSRCESFRAFSVKAIAGAARPDGVDVAAHGVKLGNFEVCVIVPHTFLGEYNLVLVE